MSKKYNSKKKLSQGAILGNALRTDFQEFNKPVLKYANVPSDWLEKEEIAICWKTLFLEINEELKLR